MATIFNFRPAHTPSRHADEARQDAACEVILFPGVRYERWDVTPAPQVEKPRTAKKPRAKKRQCELAD